MRAKAQFHKEEVVLIDIQIYKVTFGNVSSEFHFGKEMCIIPKIWQRWWWGGGAYGVRAPLFDLFDFLFSDKIKQIGVLHLKNFHF